MRVAVLLLSILAFQVSGQFALAKSDEMPPPSWLSVLSQVYGLELLAVFFDPAEEVYVSYYKRSL